MFVIRLRTYGFYLTLHYSYYILAVMALHMMLLRSGTLRCLDQWSNEQKILGVFLLRNPWEAFSHSRGNIHLAIFIFLVAPADDLHLGHVIDTMSLHVLDGVCAFEQTIMEEEEDEGILYLASCLILNQKSTHTMSGCYTPSLR